MSTKQTAAGTVRSMFEEHRRALRYHCYRMLGSLADADDFAQETISRALASEDEFEGRADARTWLFRIATNTCIDELRRRKRRRLVSPSKPNGSEEGAFDDGNPDEWVQPFPDALLPDRALARAESVTLALVAAGQWLPPRQRAVWILRDTLDWTADEVSQLLGMTPTAVHSALVRARERIHEKSKRGAGGAAPPSTDASALSVARRFANAYARQDIDTLAKLLREDVEVSMPPVDLWLSGRASVLAFLPRRMWRGAKVSFRVSRANGRPAVLLYEDDAPFAVVSFELDRRRAVRRLHAFLLPPLVQWFERAGAAHRPRR